MPYLTLLLGLVLGTLLGGLLLRRKPAAGDPGLAVFDQRPVGVLVVNERKIVWSNARAAELFGVPPGALDGAGARAFHQDEHAYRTFADAVLAVCERGEAFRGDVHLRRMDGTPFWAYMVGGLRVPGKPEEGVLWFLEDVTDRVEAQLDLAEVLALNQKLIAASPTGILLYRAADGACIMANEAAARIVQGRPEDLLRQSFRRVPSWTGSGMREAADRALATGLEQRIECHFVSSFGKEVWIHAHFVPFLSRGERLFLLLADDISDRVEASNALRASEEKYRVVVEALNEGLALVDGSGCFTFCNSRLSEMGGYTAEEMVGKHYSLFVREGDLPVLQSLQILARSAQAGPFELGLCRKDGSIQESRVSVAAVQDARNAVAGVAILVTDISAPKRVERERERLLGELGQKNKELETLLYVASHDLRSPLVNIQGFSQRLAKSLEELRKQQEACASLEAFSAAAAPHLQERMPASLEFIRASGVKMDNIINGLLTLSRAGRMVLKAEVLDMNAILGSCRATLAFQLQSVDGVLEVEELPPCTADAVQTAQILSNLLDNAIKYRHPDRPLRVKVSGAVAEGHCEYRVEDNGVGIAIEHRERIWEIFQRLAPQGPVPGDGLGLTLVRRMAERNGGRVRVESGAGHGCVFYLELPPAP